MNSPISPPWKLMHSVKHRRPQQAPELVWAWISETGLKGCRCLCVTQTLGQRQQEHEGVKNAALSNRYHPAPPPPCTPLLSLSLSSNPLPGLTETGQTPTMLPAILPAPRAPPDSSGIRDGDRTRSTAGRRISTILCFALFYCLALASQRCLSGSAAPPALNVLILLLLKGKGHTGLWHPSLTGNELQTVVKIMVKI